MGEPTTHDREPHGSAARGSDPSAFLITDAPESFEVQQRARVRKYLTLMAFRVPALVIAGIVYSATGNGWIAMAIVVGSIPLPWIAVLVANDRPPRKRGVVPSYLHGPDHSVIGPAELGPTAASGPVTTPPDEPRDADSRQMRTIDSHLVDPD